MSLRIVEICMVLALNKPPRHYSYLCATGTWHGILAMNLSSMWSDSCVPWPQTCSIKKIFQFVNESEEPDKREMLLARDITPTRYAESQPEIKLSHHCCFSSVFFFLKMLCQACIFLVISLLWSIMTDPSESKIRPYRSKHFHEFWWNFLVSTQLHQSHSQLINK